QHRQFLQLYMASHGEPVRRLRDHTRMTQQTLIDRAGKLTDVNFRVGKYGRFEWTTHDDEDLYIQFFPPSLQDMASPAEFMLQQMARAGVDRAVLQNARLYGRLNDYFAGAIKQYPGKFVGLADVEEPNPDLAELRRAVHTLGLKGVYYAGRGHFPSGFAAAFDSQKYDPYWEEVASLGIPVFWELFGPGDVERLDGWLRRWPTIRSVWTHGFDPGALSQMPDDLQRLLEHEQLSVEILYPIHWARDHEYPFPELRPALATLYQHCGGERLIWGSDMPNVERNCTYRQSLHYLRVLAEGVVPSADLDRILGTNTLRLFGMDD
ncbi:MAG TPA: amidohydrolase family protein, partial [Chloroflexota bacterium]|nr:amidohydrolase family protein [Chloroflexota bacterium]